MTVDTMGYVLHKRAESHVPFQPSDRLLLLESELFAVVVGYNFVPLDFEKVQAYQQN